jgi:hypothetical protein
MVKDFGRDWERLPLLLPLLLLHLPVLLHYKG